MLFWNKKLVQCCKNRTCGRWQSGPNAFSHCRDCVLYKRPVAIFFGIHAVMCHRIGFLICHDRYNVQFCDLLPRLLRSIHFSLSFQHSYDSALDLKSRSRHYVLSHIPWSQFYSVTPLSLACKGRSSSVWCQQCWLIKAVGRQCVIHSYSWHVYYSPLNTNN